MMPSKFAGGAPPLGTKAFQESAHSSAKKKNGDCSACTS
jgi:hypothetical protein